VTASTYRCTDNTAYKWQPWLDAWLKTCKIIEDC